MGKYRLIYTDTGITEKTIIRGQKNTSGSANTSALQLSVIDENDNAVDITGFTIVAKLYVGSEGALKIDGLTIAVVNASAGTLIYRLAATDFDAASEADTGTHSVEVYLADNASPTKAITANGATLHVIPSIID